MLKNYYITAIRNLQKHKSYFLLNVSGLAIGIASFIFLSLLISNELSYDKFHENYQDTYRIQVKTVMMGNSSNMSVTAAPMAAALKNEYPEVEEVTRIKESGAWVIGHDDKKFNEDGVLFVDSTFFEVFDFKLISGNKKTALVKPRSMILTKSYAQKYFGNDNPIGQKITVERDTTFYTITGILEDVPDNSHFQFDMLGSMSSFSSIRNDNMWVSHNFHTYVKLREGSSSSDFEEKIQELIIKYVGPQVEQILGIDIYEYVEKGNDFSYYLMPLADIHLHSHVEDELGVNSDISYIYIYSLVALTLLFIAVINFINLATAQSSSRAKEVGIRKVSGSTKRGLVYQFIFESILVSIISTILAYVIVVLSTPYFTQLIDSNLSVDITTNYWSWVLLLLLAIIIGVLAGFYPAFVLAAFKPSSVLSGTYSKGAKSSWLRNLLVVIQFTASIVIIIGTFIVYGQTDYMINKNLGFDKEQILVIRRSDVLGKKLETFKNELILNSNVASVANSVSIPGKDRYNNNAYMINQNPNTPCLMYENAVSYEYGELMGFELLEGRFFSKEYSSDSTAIIINETAAKALGFDDPLSETLSRPIGQNKFEAKKIIGVVRDHHIKSLHEPIKPSLMYLMPGNWEGYVTVKLTNSKHLRETIDGIESSWLKHSGNKPFQYFFFDEDYENLYKSESIVGNVFLIFAFLSIFIACLGLIGLITYTLTIRNKEIGIRKVLGANSGSLVNLLSGEILKLIAISTLLGWPLAYFATDYWLQNFASRLEISFWIYLGATLTVFFIGMFAISFQTLKASLKNPIEALRQE